MFVTLTLRYLPTDHYLPYVYNRGSKPIIKQKFSWNFTANVCKINQTCCILHCLIISVHNSFSLLQYEWVQGSFGSNAMGTAAPLVTNNMMPFGDNSMMFPPPIRGEFINLLLQAEYEVPAS